MRVRVLRFYPSLRQDIPHRTGESLKTLTLARRGGIDDVVKDQVAFKQRHLLAR